MFKSIHTRVLSSQLFLVALVSITMGVSVSLVVNSYLHKIQKEQNNYIAQSWAHNVGEIVSTKRSELSAIAKSKIVEIYSHEFNRKLLTKYLISISDKFSEISYFTENNVEEIRIVSGKQEESHRQALSIIARALEIPNTPIMEVVLSNKESTPENVAQALPYLEFAIYNESFGDFAGILLARVSLQPGAPLLKTFSTFKFGQAGFLSLYDLQGTTLIHHNSDNILVKIELPKHFADSGFPANAQLSFQRDQIFGIDGYSSYTQVPNSDLVVAATLPYSKYKEIPTQIKGLVFLIGIFTAIVCFIISAVLAKSISQPLFSLTKITTRLAKGDWDHEIEIKASGEVGQLSHSFQEMSNKLQEMIISRDSEINLRRKVEQAIKVSHLELDQIFNNTAGGMLVVDLSKEIIKVNDTFLSIFGYDRQDVIGKNCYDLFPKDSCGTDQCIIHKVLKADSTVVQETEEYKKDGTPIICNLVAVPFYGANGDLIGVLEDFRDITIAKQAETLVKISEERYRLLFNSAPDSIAVLNNQGVIIDCNHATTTIYKRPRTELIGRYFTHFNTAESAKISIENFEALQKKTQVEGEVVATLPDGREAAIWRKGTSILDRDGNFDGVLIYDRDISKQKEDESMREDMSRIAQHDLKSPLNGIINLPTLIKMEKNLTETQNKRLDLIVTAGYNMLNMINNSLDLYKMEQKTYNFVPVEVEITSIISKINEELWPSMQGTLKQIRVISINRPKESPPSLVVLGEELLCYSMLANLIKNAVEAAPKASIVTISIDDSQGALIKIHNKGQILASIRDSFFEKYKTEGKRGGTGLGTYSARLMARVQKGEITMASSLREGTTITIKLPSPNQPDPVKISTISTDAEKSISKKVGKPNPAPTTKVLKILLAEDDPINQTLVTALLQEKFASEITTVDNGKKAVKSLSDNNFDLVLMDMQMPEMDGVTATKKIRQVEASTDKRTPIIALTGMSSKKDSKRFFEAGIDAFIAKPIQIDLLWTAIEELLGIES